jgi:riboflavin kinase/FMN adenylyltransferase
MKLFRHYTPLPEQVRGTAVALGNFDGVHRGHRAVIAAAQEQARALGKPSAVLTFEPHPRSQLGPAAAPFRLTPFRPKARLIEALGVGALFVIHFDEAFSHRSAEEFVEEVLVAGLGVRHVVVGYDFVFGHNRAGGAELLRRLGATHGFGVTEMQPVTDPVGGAHSSTRIRALLQEGRPDKAAEALGHAWEIEGRVEHGDKRGRTIGFPTANLELGEYLRPRFGVYAVRAGIDQGERTRWVGGVANLGSRPTVGGVVERLEVHLFDIDEDLYGRHLRVQMLHFLRPEQRFASFEALKVQIEADSAAARAFLARRAGEPGGLP